MYWLVGPLPKVRIATLFLVAVLMLSLLGTKEEEDD
jgi:hypothetical protein